MSYQRFGIFKTFSSNRGANSADTTTNQIDHSGNRETVLNKLEGIQNTLNRFFQLNPHNNDAKLAKETIDNTYNTIENIHHERLLNKQVNEEVPQPSNISFRPS